jgi:hypothetical protein
VPERVGFKVLPIPTKSLVLRQVSKEAVGEQQEPPCIYAGEVSDKIPNGTAYPVAPVPIGVFAKDIHHVYNISLQKFISQITIYAAFFTSPFSY